ncbi:hypothetical protein [Microcella sp.]|uniref:hypothetical protein n=1 Tax=Microcella sp. TaxID=1913979 RepID=UPI00256CFC2B|nr:hypothetical protein [Microcella sp.]MBX9472724.1 hypothetical protein [Microcella sp.]
MTAALKWMAGRLLRLLPEALRGRVLPGRYDYRVADIPPPIEPPSTPVRLFIAPVNYAGQAHEWGRAAAQNLPGVGAVNLAFRTPDDFTHASDAVVPVGVWAASSRWQRELRRTVLGGFTHAIVEAQRWPFGAPLDESVHGQVQSMLRAGLRVAMLCHGSDIRLPSRHAALNPDSPFAGALATTPDLERTARESRRLLDRLGLPVFVSTADLLIDAPEATWLPVVIDVEAWRVEARVMQAERPVVVHAPSKGAIKGSDLVDPVAQRLHDEGLIEYRRIEGVPHAQMREVYRGADIVLDQFRIGDYGVAACEGMAAGRLVVGHVNPGVRRAALEASGIELPIVDATGATLEAVLRGIVADRDRAAAVAATGAEFVRVLHDGRRSADVLRPFLLGAS